MIDIEQLRFVWPGQSQPVLAIEALQLQAGHSAFLQGPSGSGKSTLLSLLCGVLVPGSGQLRVLGQDMRQLSAPARDALRADRIGLIFQQFNLLPYLSVRENVTLAARFAPARAQRCRPDLAAEAEHWLDRMELPRALFGRRADTLSVGQQQRVAAARALLGQPALVLADEPTSALDARLQERFMQTLLEACRDTGAALVCVSHDPRWAPRFDHTWSLTEINRVEQPCD